MDYEIVGSDTNQTKRIKIYQKKIIILVIGILSAVLICDMYRCIKDNYSLYQYDKVEYDNAAITISNTRDTKTWNIPTTYRGRTVTSASLSQSKSETIHIGDTLEKLYIDGFSNLKTIEIPDNMFLVSLENCPVLSEVTFKGTLYELDLTDCPGLDELIVDNQVTLYRLVCDNITANHLSADQIDMLSVSNSKIKYMTIKDTSRIYLKDSTFETIEIIGDTTYLNLTNVSLETKFLIDKDTNIEAVLIKDGYSYQYRE